MKIHQRLTGMVRAEIGRRLRALGTRWAGARAGRPKPQGAGHQRSHHRAGGSASDPRRARNYANLELPYGAGPEEIAAARKRLARRYHPDLHATDPERQEVANEIMKELDRAYRELMAHF